MPKFTTMAAYMTDADGEKICMALTVEEQMKIAALNMVIAEGKYTTMQLIEARMEAFVSLIRGDDEMERRAPQIPGTIIKGW